MGKNAGFTGINNVWMFIGGHFPIELHVILRQSQFIDWQHVKVLQQMRIFPGFLFYFRRRHHIEDIARIGVRARTGIFFKR